jgi:hypothetical protein
VEAQQSGLAHLHCLVDRFIDQRWLSDAWQRIGGGRIVDIRFVDVHRISPYLSKYFTKNFLVSDWSGKKRISTSRGIRLFEKIVKKDWNWTRDNIHDVYCAAFANGVPRRVLRDGAGIVSFWLWNPCASAQAL